MIIEIPKVKTSNTVKASVLAVILTKNKIKDVIGVIDSLLSQKYADGTSIDVNIAIGDTGSNFDERLKWKRYWETLSDDTKSKIIKINGLQYHFAKNNNHIVESVIKPDFLPQMLLFCNNDVEIMQDNVLDQMLSVYNLYPNIGTIGVQSLFPVGTVQHQGIDMIETNPNEYGFSHIGYQTHKYDFLPRIVMGNSGFFMMTRTDLFIRLGMFKTNTLSCMEDVMYNIDCLSNGFLNICVNSAILYHNESSTRDKNDPKYHAMIQNDLKLVNNYLNEKGIDGKSKAELLQPFIRKGYYVPKAAK